MTNRGKCNLLGVQVHAVDYEAAVDAIMAAAHERRGFAVSALAVHGVMTGATNAEHRFRLNSLDLITPDGQPVRWALNLLYKTELTDRVYGPNLTLKVMEACARERTPIYLYGTTDALLCELRRTLNARFPDLVIAGSEPSRFGPITKGDRVEIANRIHASGAKVTFVGIGCPRQEIWACEFRDLLSMPILAVGAAFPFIAGQVRQAPGWMQSRGLEWAFRLATEPTRLWKRYVLLNPLYIAMVALQACGGRFSSQGVRPAPGPIPG